jgi:two-component system, NtrC family, sensor kinase
VNNFSELSRDLLADLLELVERPGQAQAEIKSEFRELADLLAGNLKKIMHHGQRADSIVRTMLLHSRGQGGEHRQLAINPAVEEALNLAYHGARAETPDFNVELIAALGPSAGEADVYPQEFTRVLLNLFGNAFHALRKLSMSSPPGGWTPRLEVATRGDASSVTVVVRDNGTGIPQALKDRIFEPFFTTKPAGEGTGLGLSLSYDIIVKQHGGTLTVDSGDGAGACFSIVLPRRQKEAEAAE